MKRILSLILLILYFAIPSFAGRISGTVTDDKGNTLPFASVFVKGTTKGTTANNQGTYFLDMDPGTYTVICQYVGYTRQEKKIVVGAQDLVLNFSLPLQQTTMKEVIVRPGW